MIRIPQVRVVDEEGAQLGVMPTPQALEMAQERGYDLVEVAPMAQPPVVKFLDGTNSIVAITTGGDGHCRSLNYNFRLDTADARAFLGAYVTLP